MLKLTVIQLKDTLDKTKAPEYILNINEEYVSFNHLGQLLKLKYFGLEVDENDLYLVGFQAKLRMVISDEDMTNEEVLARTILLIEELQNYKFYIISDHRTHYISFNFSKVLFAVSMALFLTSVFNYCLF